MKRTIRHRLPKAARLLKRREFLLVQRQGKRQYVPSFTVIKYPRLSAGRHGKATGEPRLGLAVTRRIGKAVVRNRIKRLVREFFRLHREKMPPAHDILIIPKAGAEKLRYAQVAKELGRALYIANRDREIR